MKLAEAIDVLKKRLGRSKGMHFENGSPEKQYRDALKAVLAHLDRERLTKAVAEGFGGVMKGTGALVDRREHPDAIPLQKNTLLGCPEPKAIELCQCAVRLNNGDRCERCGNPYNANGRASGERCA